MLVRGSGESFRNRAAELHEVILRAEEDRHHDYQCFGWHGKALHFSLRGAQFGNGSIGKRALLTKNSNQRRQRLWSGAIFYLSQSSSSMPRSVFSSRYFTMTGVYSERFQSAAAPFFTAREPGTTTAFSGTSRVPSEARYTF